MSADAGMTITNILTRNIVTADTTIMNILMRNTAAADTTIMNILMKNTVTAGTTIMSIHTNQPPLTAMYTVPLPKLFFFWKTWDAPTAPLKWKKK